jgi:hypothetical protein
VSYTDPIFLAFEVLPALLAAFLVWATWFAARAAGDTEAVARRRAILTAAGAAVWMTATWLVADSGALRQWHVLPPPLMLLVIAITALAARLAFGPSGRRIAAHLPLTLLVGVQGFRLPLELAMHDLAARGIMPPQMTYTGWNFDIATGATAIVVAILIAAGRGSRGLVLAWNVLGLALLTNVVVIAIVSTPTFGAFRPHDNVFVTYPPFVWLPAVMVLAALAGHLLIFRAIASSRSRT